MENDLLIYEKPLIEIVEFSLEDCIAISGANGLLGEGTICQLMEV